MDSGRSHPTQLVGVATPAALAAVLAGVLLGRFLRRVEVHGESMVPVFLPGDRLVVLAVRAWVTPGQVVAVTDPRSGDRLLVKRVAAVGPTGIDVRGDNAEHSTDSRQFGPVAPAAIVGRVVYRYAPPSRVAWRPGAAAAPDRDHPGRAR